MTDEEKNILIKDICARLPYGVRYKGDGGWGINPYQHTTAVCTILNSEEPLLYLRPMSSMTEEEKLVREKLRHEVIEHLLIDRLIDFYNSHHLDWRGLILMNIALEAPEGMYKID